MCKEGMGIYESDCHGMKMFTDGLKVVIDKDSCYNGCYKVMYRKTRTFPDKSFLIYDEVLLCSDRKLLIEIADVIKKEFD